MADAFTDDRIRLGHRPLIVSDIDEVVLAFLDPFKAFLDDCGRTLLPRSFRLTGNIVAHETGQAVSETEVKELLNAFYGSQELWQTPASGVVETLAGLSAEADIVFLTAMPPRYAMARRALLDRLGLPYPLIASEEPKGPIVQNLHGGRSTPLVFVDDILRNLQSVQSHAEPCLLINLIVNAEFRALAPTPETGIRAVADWPEAAAAIRAHFGR